MKRDWQRGRGEAGDSRWAGDRDRAGDNQLGLAVPIHGPPSLEMRNANQDLGVTGVQLWVGCPQLQGPAAGTGGAGGPAGHPRKLAKGREHPALCEPRAHRSVAAVWKGVIEGTAHAGQVRVTASESYRTLAAEAARSARLSKERTLKKVPGQGHVPCARAVGTAVPPG